MGIFDSLAGLGIRGSASAELYEEEDTEVKDEKELAEALSTRGKQKEPELNESDFIFDKTITCPVCGKVFKTKTVKTGKARFLGTDSDLRPRHNGVDTVKYDTIVCLHCGYASVPRMFSNVTSSQMKNIREQISATFIGMVNGPGIYTYEEAIRRFQLTLYNCVVRKLHTSERAYICLKLAWLFRGYAQSLDGTEENYEELKAECEKNEKEMTENAYDGFKMALMKESGAICGMDKNTFSYLLAELGRKCGDYDNAGKYLEDIIISGTATAKVKNKARELREQIAKEKETKALEN